MIAVQELAFDINAPTSIVKLVEKTPSLVLVDLVKFDELYAEMEREVKAHVPDLTTAGGRKEIGSLAYKVARTKTAIDDAGKKLTEDKRNEIKLVDASRKTIRERLDSLRDEARRPLTEWEDAEEKRVSARKAELDTIRAAAVVTPSMTVDEIASRIVELEALTISQESHQEFAPAAETARKDVLAILASNLERIRKEEADRAELVRLRAEAAERARIEQERVAAERAEANRIKAERVEAERQARVAEEDRQRVAAAEAAAQRRAEEAAEAEKRRIEATHAAELKRIRDEQDAERLRIEREAKAKADAERAEKEAADRRAADREHRSKIMGAAKEALMEQAKISEAKAKDIVLAIAAGGVPHVSIRF